MSARSKLIAARTSLVLDQPFFGMLSLSLKLVEDAGCETAWTDGRSLGYDPAFVESLSHDELTGLLAHEVLHNAMGHPWRRDGREIKGWNAACDLAINHELVEAGFKLPKDGLMPDSSQRGKSAEWIYARLGQDEPTPQGNGQGQPQAGQGEPSDSDKPNSLGEVRDAPITPDADGQEAPTEQEWKQRTAQAAQQAKLAGKLPGGLQRLAKEALKPKLDIRSLLLRFFSERASGDFSWSRPSPRFLPMGLYLPVLESKSLGTVSIMVDTSGSVDESSLSYARGIVESVIEECQPQGISIWYADAEVKRVDRFTKGEPLTWKPEGGGGTNFCPALKAICDEGESACIVCITDLQGTLPDSEPEIPTLWLCTTDLVAPWGETVPLDR